MALTGELRDQFYASAESEIIRAAHYVDPHTGAIGIPRTKAVTFATQMSADPADFGRTLDHGLGYGVYRHPAWTKLEDILSAIENGGDSVVAASGRAGIDLILNLLPKNEQNHIIVAPGDIYIGTRAFFKDLGLDVSYVDATSEALEAARKPNTRMVLTEPLTNPRMMVADLDVISAFAKKHKILSVADNTSTPLAVRPLDYGFDLVAQCMTKYISGSNADMGGGIVVNKDRLDLAQQLKTWRNRKGNVLHPDTAATMIEQATHFPSRFKNHSENALKVAQFLETRREVAVVNHPGLESHPQYGLAQKQFNDYGALFSFELKGGRPQIAQFVAGVEHSRQPILLADSFGAAVSLLSYPVVQSMLLRDMDPEQRQRDYGVNDRFLRLSVGRGSVESIIEGLKQGLDAIDSPEASR